MLPVVSDSFEFASQNPTTAEKAKRAAVWAKILCGIVPEERLPDAFRRAVEIHKTPFPINGYEIKLAWEQIEASELEALIATEQEAEKNKNPIDICADRDNHVNENGEVEMCNPLNFAETVVVPCSICRPKAFAAARSAFIAKNRVAEKDIVPKMLQQLEKTKPKSVVEQMKLSAAEINALRDDHNRLVRQLVEDAEARRNLEIVWDEGGNCFKLPHRADLTWSAEIVRGKIESYRKIVAEKK